MNSPPKSSKPLALLSTSEYREPDLAERRTEERIPVALVAGSGTQPTSDIQVLLHKRLRVVNALFLLGGPLFVLMMFAQSSSLAIWLLLVPVALVCLVAALVSGVLWWKRTLSLRALRSIELLLFGTIVAMAVTLELIAALHWRIVGNISQLHRQQGLLIMPLFADQTALQWIVIMLSYGIFIPNTAWRCAVVVIGIALAPLVIHGVCGLLDERVDRGHLLSLLQQMALWLSFGVVFAVYGSHRIEVLRQQAAQARKLGQYQLKRRLGTGGMGEVYLAEHALLRRPCALKLIRPERSGDPKNLRRFEREVQATATLTHPNTMQIFDYGHAADGTFYYVMEYLPGLTLEELVGRHGPLPPERALHFLRQVCGALREAHAIGLLHRDLKPSNIMVCERGGRHDVAKLLDFGLVQPVTAPDGEGGARLTQEGAITGTPAYMSPEQAASKDSLDARSDIYSLGCVADFLLTGKTPFAGASAVAILAAHLFEPPAPLTNHRPDVPLDFQEVVLRCLVKDPAGRHADVDSLERALASCHTVGPWTEAQAANCWQGQVS